MTDKPFIGQKAKGRDIGKNPYELYIWHACELCGSERWVVFLHGQPRNKICNRCHYKDWSAKGTAAVIGKKLEQAHHWKGGRKTHSGGYMYVMLSEHDPFYPMADERAYILEHRLIMAKHLDRCLDSLEIVHHIDGNRKNNKLDNLQLLSIGEHLRLHREGACTQDGCQSVFPV